MRVALITVDLPATVAGRGLSLRQLDFARAAGAERVIAAGDGFSPQAIALRHGAEREGLRFQHLATGQALLGSVGTADELLVIAPGLLPEAAEALDLLGKGPGVLTLPAAPACAAGFERIDPQRAWAGVLLMPGGLVERLSDLPPGFALAPALLRIALQGRVPDRPLPPGLLDDGSWANLMGPGDPALDAAWLKRHGKAAPRSSASARIAGLALRLRGPQLLAQERAPAFSLGAALVLLAGAVAAAAAGVPVAGLALAGLASVPLHLWHSLSQLACLPFGRPAGKWARRLPSVAGWLADASLGTVAALGIDGPPAQRLFAAAVMVLALRHARPARWPALLAWLPDRLISGALLALAAGFGHLPAAVMALSLVLLAAELARRGSLQR